MRLTEPILQDRHIADPFVATHDLVDHGRSAAPGADEEEVPVHRPALPGVVSRPWCRSMMDSVPRHSPTRSRNRGQCPPGPDQGYVGAGCQPNGEATYVSALPAVTPLPCRCFAVRCGLRHRVMAQDEDAP